jgi:hypothetical protein
VKKPLQTTKPIVDQGREPGQGHASRHLSPPQDAPIASTLSWAEFSGPGLRREYPDPKVVTIRLASALVASSASRSRSASTAQCGGSFAGLGRIGFQKSLLSRLHRRYGRWLPLPFWSQLEAIRQISGNPVARYEGSRCRNSAYKKTAHEKILGC